MLAANYGAVSDIEVLWTSVAFVAGAFSIFNLIESYKDYRFIVKKQISNGRYAVAQSALFNEIFRLFILSVFFTIGVLAMFLPEAPANAHIPLAQRLIGAAVRWGLILSSLAIAGQTYTVRRVRKEVNKKAGKYKV